MGSNPRFGKSTKILVHPRYLVAAVLLWPFMSDRDIPTGELSMGKMSTAIFSAAGVEKRAVRSGAGQPRCVLQLQSA